VAAKGDVFPAASGYSIVVALLTPFTYHGEIDRGALRDHVEVLIEEGVDALMPCGTTGEGPLLEDEEVSTVVDTVIAASSGRVPVLAHVGRPATGATVNLARAAGEGGASAVSAVTPYYYPLTDDQLGRHYRAVMGAVPGLPVFAYAIPDRTGNDVSVELARSLAADGLAGIKDSTRSFPRHLEYLAVAQDQASGSRRFSVFMGSDSMVLEAMRHGSAGSVSAMANVAPHLLMKIRRGCVEGSEEEAKAAQDELTNLLERMSQGPALGNLKDATSRYLSDRGIAYPSSLRPPL
jgi:4-hydroxy-tetrahydrodipicolinate synthase